jgi:hypothetical protein
MEGETHQSLNGSPVMVRWSLSEPSKKGKGGSDRAVKGTRGSSRGWGIMSLVSAQDLRMNLGRVAAHCFPGCKSRELRVKPKCPSQVLVPSVRLKEAWKRQKDSSNTSTAFIIQKESVQSGISTPN